MGRNLDWRWIGIGTAIMFGLNFVGGLLVSPLLGDASPAPGTDLADAAATIGGGRLLLGSVIAIATFTLGGFIVGLKSPGRTILEPGLSAAIAVVLSLMIGGVFSIGNVLVAGLMPFLAGLLGGYLGERRQSAAGGPDGPLR